MPFKNIDFLPGLQDFKASPVNPTSRSSGTIRLVACMLVVLCGTDGWQLWRTYNASIRESALVSSNTARLVAEQAETTVKTADTIVGSLAERVEADGLGPESRTRLYGLMTSLAAALPAIHEMGVTDDSGNAIVKSLKPDPSGLNYSERMYFQHHKNNPDREPFLGEPVQSKIDGTLSITVTRRVDNPDGSFGGLVVASVSLNYFQQLFSQMQARSGGVLALLSDTGRVLVRSPPDDRSAFEILPGASLPDPLTGHADDVGVDYVSAVDGVKRLGSVQRTSQYSMQALVSQAYWDIQRGWRNQLVFHGLIIGSVTSVLLVLGGREVRATRALNRQALHDSLTGLPNRRFFDERLSCEFRHANQSGQPLSLIMIDIDHFKQYNDHYGHPGGDKCLQQAARLISARIGRAGGFAARYGGEEFVIILPGSSPSQALALAEATRCAMHDMALPHAGGTCEVVTLSAGVATHVPGHIGFTRSTLVEAADEALYQAKASGRNATVLSPSCLAVDHCLPG